MCGRPFLSYASNGDVASDISTAAVALQTMSQEDYDAVFSRHFPDLGPSDDCNDPLTYARRVKAAHSEMFTSMLMQMPGFQCIDPEIQKVAEHLRDRYATSTVFLHPLEDESGYHATVLLDAHSLFFELAECPVDLTGDNSDGSIHPIQHGNTPIMSCLTHRRRGSLPSSERIAGDGVSQMKVQSLTDGRWSVIPIVRAVD